MTITRNFKLCLNAGTQNAPYINVNQYDEGEQWIFDLYTEGGQKFTPSTGAIIGIKSDGNAILNSGTVNSDGQVVITETQQMTAASGLAVFELLIEGETHGTANFIVNVERRPSDDAEFSDSDLSMLQEAIDAAEVINEILDEGGDPSEIIAENVNAWLDNHPEATTTVEDGAITAPKINNSLWDKILVNEEASGNPASFEDGADDVPVSSLKVNLEPIQLGSGDPSPTNIRPISGRSSVTVEVTDNTTTETYSANLGQSVYGGTVDLATGVLTVDRAMVDMGSLEWNDGPFSNFTSSSIQSTVAKTSSSVLPKLLAENLKTIMYDNRNASSTDARISISPGKTLDVRGTSYENAAAFKTAVNGVKLVYELATPTTVQLTPTEVKTLLGYNNISSTGTVDVIYHADTKLYIDKKIGELS